MNIAVDLDGVLFDTESWFMTYARIHNFEVPGGEVTNKDNCWVQDRYNWPEEEIKKYIEKYGFQIESKAPIMPFAKEVLNAISKKHKVFSISARGLWHVSEEKITKKRLRREKIQFEKIEFGSHSKIEACKKNKIDIMIDDYPKNVIELAENGIKCFYFRDLARQQINHENVIEVRNWGDVAAELVKMGIIEKKDLIIKL